MMAVTFEQFYAACPGVVMSRDVEMALAALPTNSNAAAIQAVVLPLMPEGNVPVYTATAPPAMPVPMPGASPVYAAALPPQPDVSVAIDGRADMGTVPTFAKGLPRFQDSNPDPFDGWSVEFAETEFGPW